MADVKWIKITTDMFDNRKIKHLRRLPDGNNIVLIWVMLLTMAGRCNSGGMIFLTENIPYTPKMLADELDFEENTVRLALEALEQLGMILTVSGCFAIAGWSEHQNIEGMERIREQTRKRVAKHRAEQKLLQGNVTCNVTETQSNATEEDIDKEEEIEIERDKIDYKGIVAAFNEICVSFPSVKSISDARKKAIKARLKNYTPDDFRTLFSKAEASSFLKGKNNSNWSATFDWLIKDSNMAKVLDGNYDDKSVSQIGQTSTPTADEYERMKKLREKVKTAANDESIRKRAEELQKQLGR